MNKQKIITRAKGLVSYLKSRKVAFGIGISVVLFLLLSLRLSFSATKERPFEFPRDEFVKIDFSSRALVKLLRSTKERLVTELDSKAAKLGNQDYPLYESDMKKAWDELSILNDMESRLLAKFNAVEKEKGEMAELQSKHTRARERLQFQTSAENFDALMKISAEIKNIEPNLAKKEKELKEYETVVTETLENIEASDKVSKEEAGNKKP